mmetsp:Transcript_2177/g.5167  ORF Transcript_2177/g.5167 Transcript_2177/m.5167 type:complete len:159 (-) Transcript_2177:51-527(-)
MERPAVGPTLGEQCMRKPPVPLATEEQPPPPPSLSCLSFRQPRMPDLPEEVPFGVVEGAKRMGPLIEDEDDFEATICFPDGDFVRATSTSKETSSTVDTVNSSWDSASWRRDLPPGTVIQPDRRLHERHVRKMNRFLQDVELAPKTFSGIVRSRRRDP